jgi:hypothetical protein
MHGENSERERKWLLALSASFSRKITPISKELETGSENVILSRRKTKLNSKIEFEGPSRTITDKVKQELLQDLIEFGGSYQMSRHSNVTAFKRGGFKLKVTLPFTCFSSALLCVRRINHGRLIRERG